MLKYRLLFDLLGGRILKCNFLKIFLWIGFLFSLSYLIFDLIQTGEKKFITIFITLAFCVLLFLSNKVAENNNKVRVEWKYKEKRMKSSNIVVASANVKNPEFNYSYAFNRVGEIGVDEGVAKLK